jgi:hypothetical protein
MPQIASGRKRPVSGQSSEAALVADLPALSHDQRRALRLLADAPNGATATIMLARGPYVSFRRVRTWSARKHRCSEEPSGWTPAPASANGPACDFDSHHCPSPA